MIGVLARPDTLKHQAVLQNMPTPAYKYPICTRLTKVSWQTLLLPHLLSLPLQYLLGRVRTLRLAALSSFIESISLPYLYLHPEWLKHTPVPVFDYHIITRDQIRIQIL